MPSMQKIVFIIFIGILVISISVLLIVKSYLETREQPKEETTEAFSQELPSEPSSAKETKHPSSRKNAEKSLDKRPLATQNQDKWPHIDVIGPQNTSLSINVYFDNQIVCNIFGKLEANVHRPFQGGLLAEGVCHSDKLLSQGSHEYKLSGQLIMPDGAKHNVSFTTGPQEMSNVIQPSIEINSQGETIIKLAVW